MVKYFSANIGIILRLQLLALIVLLHRGNANAAGGKEHRPGCDYVEYQRLPLSKKLHGVDGSLVIVRERSLLAAEQYSFDDHETSCNARLDLEGNDNNRVENLPLERPIARIETVRLIGGRPDSFSLTVDYSSGAGSYSGPGTRFFDVVAGSIQWVQANDETTRKTGEIHVARTLKTEWRLVPYGKNQDILEISCRPAFNDATDDTFAVTYSRYRFNGYDWTHYSRSETGFWENEGDFPEEALFPPVR
jgi:hypothetical protein